VQLKVRVYPRSSRDDIALDDDQGLKVWVTSPPEAGRANDAVVKLLADKLGVPRSGVRILRGHKSRHKVIYFEGFTREELIRRIGP